MDFLNRDFLQNFIRNYRRTVIKIGLGILIFVAVFLVFCLRDSKEDFKLASEESEELNMEENSQVEEEKKEETAALQNFIYVDVSGAVARPGVYRLEGEARVYQAVDEAGGLAADADTSVINMAVILKDQDKLVIPTRREVKEGKDTEGTGRIKAGEYGVVNSQEAKGLSGAGGLININTADSAALQTIRGIGPSTAEKIIAYRQEHGSFSSKEDIKNVSGIGDKTYEKFQDRICV